MLFSPLDIDSITYKDGTIRDDVKKKEKQDNNEKSDDIGKSETEQSDTEAAAEEKLDSNTITKSDDHCIEDSNRTPSKSRNRRKGNRVSFLSPASPKSK